MNDVSVPYEMDKLLGQLAKAVKTENEKSILEAAKSCAGLGDGRYAASDKLLCGFMEAYVAFSCAVGRKREHISAVNSAILNGAALNTTRESGFMLWLASNGLSDEAGCYLFRCFLSDKTYPSLLAAATSSVNLNGCDWMAGICSFLRYFVF